MIDLYNGDCLEVMDKLIANGVIVDAIITDPPYGTTACKWDNIIPLNEYANINGKSYQNKEEFILDCYKRKMNPNEIEVIWNMNKKDGMWQKLNKLIKPNGAIVLFGSEPFSSALRMSNIKNYKYDWIYQKTTPTGHLNAKKQPLRVTENMMVFYSKQPTYNPQKTSGHIRKVSSAISRGKSIDRNNLKDKVYQNEISSKVTDYSSTERYPLNITLEDFQSDYFNLLEYLENNHKNVFNEICNQDIQLFSTDKQKNTFHPTQKPVALMEYLIKTYTNEGELVLDFTMGSGSTGVACKNLNRNFKSIKE